MPPLTPQPLRIAFTIFPEAMSLDFIGPLDILSTLSRDDPSRPASIPHVECVLVADSLEAVRMSNGMDAVPQLTFDQAEKEEWDAVLVPGGVGARPWFESNRGCRGFLSAAVPKCRFVFTGTVPTFPSLGSAMTGGQCVPAHGCFPRRACSRAKRRRAINAPSSRSWYASTAVFPFSR